MKSKTGSKTIAHASFENFEMFSLVQNRKGFYLKALFIFKITCHKIYILCQLSTIRYYIGKLVLLKSIK